MKRKVFSILFALVLVLGLSLVVAVPVAAATLTVDGSLPDTPPNYHTIQAAVTAAGPDDTIFVAEGNYVGAIVNEDLTIIGAAGGTSVITSGVPYKVDKVFETAFRLDDGADGAEIRNFTINCNKDLDFYFAVYAGGADNVIIDSLTINYPVQGISNWGGSNWQITNNVITSTEASGGGGISIYLGAKPEDGLRICSNNLAQYNIIQGEGATSPDYSCPGICLSLDTRYGGYDNLDYTEDVSGNQILDNTITVTNVTGGVGITVSVIGLVDDDVKIAAVMANSPVHDNTVKGNTIDGPWQGMVFRTLTGLTVEGNVITNCCGEGIVVEDGHAGIAIHNNNIYGNAKALPEHPVYNDPENPVVYTGYGGVYNDDTDVYYGSVNATNNWWGHASGPTHASNPAGLGDAVSDDVLFDPWLTRAPTSVGFTTTIAEKIAITVFPISIDFGSIVPGVDISGNPITVTNIGNVDINVSAELLDRTLFYNKYLRLNDNAAVASLWAAGELGFAPIAPADPGLQPEGHPVSTALVGIPTVEPPGPQTDTLIFWAEKP